MILCGERIKVICDDQLIIVPLNNDRLIKVNSKTRNGFLNLEK